MTSFNPLPAHLNAVQEEFPSGGMTTPTYGGTVNTGMEWDYVVGPDGRRRCVLFALSHDMRWTHWRVVVAGDKASVMESPCPR